MSVTPFPDKLSCRYCGNQHKGEAYPLIEAIEYDPDTQNITRIEFRDMTEDECG